MRTEKVARNLGGAIAVSLQCTLLAVGILPTAANAQSFTPIAPFKSLCIEDSATGFDWAAGKWKQTNFKAGDRHIASKLSNDEIARIGPIACTQEKVADAFMGFRTVSACYAVKAFGEEMAQVFDGEMCKESYKDDALISIKCEKISFLPNGSFIKLPWHADLSRNPKNDYKDSLVLSVGVCSKISQ